jgi:hypothetical protein
MVHYVVTSQSTCALLYRVYKMAASRVVVRRLPAAFSSPVSLVRMMCSGGEMGSGSGKVRVSSLQ